MHFNYVSLPPHSPSCGARAFPSWRWPRTCRRRQRRADGSGDHGFRARRSRTGSWLRCCRHSSSRRPRADRGRCGTCLPRYLHVLNGAEAETQGISLVWNTALRRTRRRHIFHTSTTRFDRIPTSLRHFAARGLVIPSLIASLPMGWFNY